MFAKCFLLLALVPVLFVWPTPQTPQSGMGREDTGAPPIALGAPTPYEQFAARLKLDKKTQAPVVEQIFSEAQKEAAPVGQQMLQLRQQLVNLALANKPEETKPVVEAYTAAAATMTGIEARAFAKVYATLKPNQQSSATQAFAIMAGMFQPSAPRAGGPRRSRPDGGRR